MTSESVDKLTSRKDVLREGIQRLHQLLAAENACHPGAEPLTSAGAAAALPNGFSRLFAGQKSIPSKAVEPYVDFSNGVWAGFEALDGACWVVMAFEPAHTVTTSDLDHTSKSPRLIVHPVVTGAQPPRWVTVESDVDKKPIKTGSTLTIRLLSNFVFPDSRSPGHANTVRAALRCGFKNGHYEDIDVGHIPVTTAVMHHAQSASLDDSLAQSIRQAASLRLILFLPPHGGYVFNLFDLSLDVT